jgi:hypothetical protein
LKRPASKKEIGAPPTLAILGLDEGPEAGTAAVVAERATALGWRRVGIVAGPSECAAHRKELWDAIETTPPPMDGLDAFFDALDAILAAHDVDALVPATYPCAVASALLRPRTAATRRALPRFFRGGLRTFPSLDLVAAAMRRKPKVAPIARVATADARTFVAPYAIGFPCDVAFEDGSTRRVVDLYDARARLKQAEARGLLAAAFTGGDASKTFETAVVADARGRPIAVATARVLADDAALRTWAAATCAATEAEAEAVRVVAKSGLVGPVVLVGAFAAGGVVWRRLRPGFPRWLAAAAEGGVDLLSAFMATHAGLPFQKRIGTPSARTSSAV